MSSVYISKALRKDIPSDAILLTHDQVVKMHWDTIKNWTPKREVWPFRYGIGLLSGLNAVTVFSLIHHYRRRLNLGNYGRITMVLPTAVLPCLFSTFSHYSIITSSVFLGEECPLCIETRAAAFQVGLGVVYPVLVTPIAAFYYAIHNGTYRLPELTLKNVPELFHLWVNMTRKLKMKLPMYIFANALAASTLTYFEADSFHHIQRTLYEREENFKKLVNEGLPSQ